MVTKVGFTSAAVIVKRLSLLDKISYNSAIKETKYHLVKFSNFFLAFIKSPHFAYMSMRVLTTSTSISIPYFTTW